MTEMHENPYATTTVPESVSAEVTNRLPRFVKVVFILDLVACIYRLLNATASILGVTVLRDVALEEPGTERAIPYLIAEIPIGFLVGVSGGAADVLGLRRSPIAFQLGLTAAGGSVLFLAVLIGKLATWLPDIPSQLVGVSILVILAVLRLAIIWLYVVALQRFRRWTQRREFPISK